MTDTPQQPATEAGRALLNYRRHEYPVLADLADAILAIEAEFAAGLLSLRHDVASLRATAHEQGVTAVNAERDTIPFYEGQVYAYDEVLARIDAAPAAAEIEARIEQRGREQMQPLIDLQ